jgi:hypothetical protein
MARASAAIPPIRFRGIPASLAAVVAGGPVVGDDLRLMIGVKGGEPIEAPVQGDFDPRILRVTLPQHTPPGVYDGVLIVDGERSREVRVEVDPSPQLHVVPEQLRIDAHNGDLVGTDVTMLNQGNVPVELRSVQAIGIFMSGGIERALRRAYVAQPAKNERRVDIIADSLADAHGGLLKVKLEKGAGSIRPGEVRELQLVIHVPKGLDPGALYGGNWELPGLVFPIAVQVAGEKEPEVRDDEHDDNPKKPGAHK